MEYFCDDLYIYVRPYTAVQLLRGIVYFIVLANECI